MVSRETLEPSRLLKHPSVAIAIPRSNLSAFEKEPDLPLRTLCRVRPMDQIPTGHQPQIAADRSRSGIDRIRLPHGGSRHGYGIRPLEDHHYHWARRDVVDESRIERLALMLGVMTRRDIAIDHPHVEPHDLQTALLQSSDDLARQTALHRVRLQDHQRSFNCHRFPSSLPQYSGRHPPASLIHVPRLETAVAFSADSAPDRVTRLSPLTR